jgi:ribosomal protein S18 acetylase RimI-like enzyme
MSTDFNIRNYKKDDFSEMSAMWERIGLGAAHRGDGPDVIQRTIDAGGQLLVMTATGSGEIIGTSWLTVDGRRTYIHHFGISEAWQGKGLSKPLLEASLEIARNIGFQLKLEVHKSNGKAVKLYKKYGFSFLGDYDVYIIRDILAVLK